MEFQKTDQQVCGANNKYYSSCGVLVEAITQSSFVRIYHHQ